MSKYAKLIMVAVSDGTDPKKASQSNKYYEMRENGSNFDVTYGRVESTASHESYPMSKWQTKYNEKIRKGYKDVTHTVQVQVVDTAKDEKYDKIENDKVDRFLSLMKKYTDGLVSKTYTVKAQNVTQQQVDNAQAFIDKLMKLKKSDVASINSTLLELYMEIPRYMGDVRSYLLPNINLDKVLQQEQDNLDAMASQVKMLSPKVNKNNKVQKKNKTLLDVLSIEMNEIKSNDELDYLVKQLTGKKIETIFRIKKEEHDNIFSNWMNKQKNKNTRILIHGTRCSSVIPIIEQGLKIRPNGNYQFSGKVYGDGNYFSETCVKSLGYTGHDNDKILLVYEVHVGNPFTYDGWYKGNSFNLCYKELESRGFDSTFVKAGGGLLNTEIIVYKEEQARIKYIIHLKN